MPKFKLNKGCSKFIGLARGVITETSPFINKHTYTHVQPYKHICTVVHSGDYL